MWRRKKEEDAPIAFTLETLKRVHGTLQSHYKITEANQAALVEAFRLLAQLLTWSDQHEPALFDFFVEQRVRREATINGSVLDAFASLVRLTEREETSVKGRRGNDCGRMEQHLHSAPTACSPPRSRYLRSWSCLPRG